MSGNETGVKYPECTVQLTGVDGNAAAIFPKVRRELIRYLIETKGWSRQDAEKEGGVFLGEATSGDYDNMLTTCLRWVNII